MTQSTKPLCQAPFKNIRIHVVSNQTVTYRPCCNYLHYNTQHKNVNDYLLSSELQQLKTSMFGQSLPEHCKICVAEESAGQTSLRESMNRSRIPFGQGIGQIELFPSNVCNLRCFMCNPVSSSSLAAEYKAVGWLNSYNEIDTVDQTLDDIMHLPDLHTVSFIGGEFFLAKRATEILSAVRQRKLSVRLVTNATVILEQHLEQLSNITDLELQISLDAVEAAYEFMRYPAAWNQVDQNIQCIKQRLPQARVNFNFVAQPLNILHLVPAYLYANQVRVPLRTNNLIGPLWLSWAILTMEEKSSITSLIHGQMNKPLASTQKTQLTSLINTMQSSEFSSSLRDEFVFKMQTLLAHRKIADHKIRDHFVLLPSLADAILLHP